MLLLLLPPITHLLLGAGELLVGKRRVPLLLLLLTGRPGLGSSAAAGVAVGGGQTELCRLQMRWRARHGWRQQAQRALQTQF